MKTTRLFTYYVLYGPTAIVMSSNADAEVFVYMGRGGARAPDDVLRVRVDHSVTSIPSYAFFDRKKLAEVELCEGVWKLGIVPSLGATIRLPKSSSRTHSGGLTLGHSGPLFELPFVSTMALKALEHTHSLPASSPTLESHPSSQRSLITCYKGVRPYSQSSSQTM